MQATAAQDTRQSWDREILAERPQPIVFNQGNQASEPLLLPGFSSSRGDDCQFWMRQPDLAQHRCVMFQRPFACRFGGTHFTRAALSTWAGQKSKFLSVGRYPE
jgi:hypothetical protein